MINETQLKLFAEIKKAICDTIEYKEVSRNAIEVATPFLDWKGTQVSFFITEDGYVTDGGQILSQFKALRVIKDFEKKS